MRERIVQYVSFREWVKDIGRQLMANMLLVLPCILIGMVIASYKPLPLPQFIRTTNNQSVLRDTRGEAALAQYTESQWTKLPACDAALWVAALAKAAPRENVISYEKDNVHEQTPFMAEAVDQNNSFGVAIVVGYRRTQSGQSNVGYQPAAILYGGSSHGGHWRIDLEKKSDMVETSDGIGRWSEERDPQLRAQLMSLAYKTFSDKWSRERANETRTF